MNFNFSMPTKIYFGKNCIKEHREVFAPLGSKALIVTGRNSAKKNGSYDDIVEALSYAKVEHVLFDEVEENPSLETIEKGSGIGTENGVDFIIGIGGGSPMDAAKAMAIFIKNPSAHIDNIFNSELLPHLPVVAVATTSGTGSEVTQYSIVTSHKDNTKKNLGQVVFPVISFLDSKYTHDLPYNITVNTAVDAFTHLVEGYLNSNADIMSDIYGEKGFELFAQCFRDLLDKNLDEDFRDRVMLASALGGIQIAQNGTSLPHGMGYPLTYFKGLPHGLANGVLTAEYLRSFKNRKRIQRMLDMMELENLEELKAILDKLIDVDIHITEEEILSYSEDCFSNKGKLKNHTEEIHLEDIIQIYRASLLK